MQARVPYCTGYGIASQLVQPLAQRRFVRRTPTTRISQNWLISCSNQRRSRSRQQRRRVPRQIRLNDFMPAELCEASPNLPVDFNLATTLATTIASNINNVPFDALPKRAIFATNTTQPFAVNNENNIDINKQQQQQAYGSNQERPKITTTSFRRRQTRIRQQQYRQNQNIIENNRFTVLAENNLDDNGDVDLVSNVDENEPVLATNRNKKKKNRAYLAYDRIMTWIQNDTSLIDIIDASGNHAYLMASIPIYDEWIRANYHIQVWQNYLKMGTENKHWAKELVQHTKKRDDFVKIRFVKKKINQLSATIAQANATISDLKIQLRAYWSQIPGYQKRKVTADDITQTVTAAETNTTTTTTITAAAVTPKLMVVPLSIDRIRSKTNELGKVILKYLQHCTQQVKKMHETRIQLAKVQMDEFKALEDFEQIATPAQSNTHFLLKPKMKLWLIKNKNYQILSKCVELDMPPKTIDKVDFSFIIDESIISQDEAQAMHNKMHQITKDFRTQVMTSYVRSAARENEILSNEIKGIVERFPKENDDEFDAEPAYAAFKQYHEL
ncbi:unnamed protein product [Rotaria sordida]|uniref:Uncharacterized protein n=1 Tax=Rotaria sordida TaxID=392033 RepID=A0A816ETS6_9BILA|nr:unnamed protein product [Rotaria sordida]CAF1653789.1 unnamed protein product [Rotaria sordida]